MKLSRPWIVKGKLVRNPIIWPRGEMVDTADLKSSGPKRPCRFDSGRGYDRTTCGSVAITRQLNVETYRIERRNAIIPVRTGE